MNVPPPENSSRTKVAEHRRRLRQQGLRPIQMWVPDVRTASFAAAAHEQSLAAAQADGAADDQAFLESISLAIEADENEG